jgi:hypothetical protein
MDKLKQVQKFQFWILLTVALILPLVGWSIAMSGLGPEIETRAKALKDLQGQLTVSPADPNDNWKKGLDVINEEQGKQRTLAWQELWQRQKKLMVWPSKMPADPEAITMLQQEYWRTAYPKFRDAVRAFVNPYDESNPKGLVEYSEDLLPRPEEEWVTAPSINEIVASQEDLWLLEAFLKQIAYVNQGSPTIYDAPIRVIEKLYFRGGSSTKDGAKKSSGGGGGGGAVGVPKEMMETIMEKNFAGSRGRGGSGFGGLGGGQGGEQMQINSAQIVNPDEDLGAERNAASEKSGNKKAAKDNSPMGGMTLAGPGAPMPGAQLGNAGPVGGWSGRDKDRYRDDKKEWKTRGFHLEVIMDHRSVPDLLSALSNADWPITILRVQMSDYKDEDLTGTTGMAGMGGMPMPAGAGRGGSSSMQMSMPSMGSAPGGRSSASSKQARPVTSGDDGEEAAGSPTGGPQRSTLDDPNLAHVAIVGLFYIIKKPDEVKPPANSPTGGATNPGGAQTGVTPPTGNPTAPQNAATEATGDAAAEAEEGEQPAAETAEAMPADDTSPAGEGDVPETPESPPAEPPAGETKPES